MTQPLKTSPPLSEPPPPASKLPVTLVHPSKLRKRRSGAKFFRSLTAPFRKCPILTTSKSLCHCVSRHRSSQANRISNGTRLTGTLFGYRKAKVTLAIQDNPRSVPILLLELPVPTARFMTDMGCGSSGLMRVTLECEKKAGGKGKVAVLEEPKWTAFVNGRNVGYATRKEATEGPGMRMLQMLNAVSVGAGVLPEVVTDGDDGELTYMRAYFDRVSGNRDSETFYMICPDGNVNSDLSIFFVRNSS